MFLHVAVQDIGGNLARLTGLEPATPGVTGRYSNQLSYNRVQPPGPKPERRGGIRQGPGQGQAVLTAKLRNCRRKSGSYRSGAGMNSPSSPDGSWNRPCAQSPARHASRAASIRSFDDATKFHQIWRGPSIVAPPNSITRAP